MAIEETIGQLVKRKMNSELVKSIPGIKSETLEAFINDKFWPNSIPIMLFRNMLRLLNIDFDTAKEAIYITLPILPKSSTRKNTRPELWECKEAVDKYVIRLKELLNPPVSRLNNTSEAMKQELSVALYWLTKCFDGKELSDKERKRLQQADYVLKKYSNPLDALRTNPESPSPVPEDVEEAGEKWAKDNIPDEFEDTAEEQYVIDAFLAGHAYKGQQGEGASLNNTIILCEDYLDQLRATNESENETVLEVFIQDLIASLKKVTPTSIPLSIVEKLEAANPWKEDKDGQCYHAFGTGFRTCVSKLKELLQSQPATDKEVKP